MRRFVSVSLAVGLLFGSGCTSSAAPGEPLLADPVPPAITPEPIPVAAPVVADPVPTEQPSAVTVPKEAPPAIALPSTMPAASDLAAPSEAPAPLASPDTAVTPTPTTAPSDLLSIVTADLAAVVAGEAPAANAYPSLALDDQRYAIAVVQGLRDSLASLRKSQPTPDAVPSLLLMADRLRALAPLEIARIGLCMRVEAFGVYEPIESALPANRDTNVVLYCELAGFHSRQADRGMYETRVNQTVSIADAAGKVLWTDADHSFVDICRSRRRDFYVARIVRIPASLPPGEHVMNVAMTDQYSRELATAQVTFTVAP